MRQVRENDATSGPGLLADNLYDPLSRRIRILRVGGIWQPTCFVYDLTTCFAYDNASRLTQLQQNLAGPANDQTLGFAYNSASQITQRTAANDAYGRFQPRVQRKRPQPIHFGERRRVYARSARKSHVRRSAHVLLRPGEQADRRCDGSGQSVCKPALRAFI
jgi:hypothetical protein